MDDDVMMDVNISTPVTSILKDIFPDELLRSFVLDVLSVSIYPKNPPRHIYFCFGTGSNGKSVFFSLLGVTFQFLFCTVTSKFLSTNTESTNAPSPMLLSLKGKRLVVNPETNESPYSSSTLKRLCGGD
ncbi:hypothetical protein HZS_1383, partial [Henneguya salminicola]